MAASKLWIIVRLSSVPSPGFIFFFVGGWKGNGELPLPPSLNWDDSPLQVFLSNVPIYVHLGGKRHCVAILFCLIKQQHDRDQDEIMLSV